MAVLGGIPGGSYTQVAITGGTTSSTTTSGKTNTSTNTGTTSSNTTTQTGNSSSSQNASGASGAASSGTSASNSTSNGGNTTNVTVAPSVADKTGAISLQEAEAQRAAAEAAQRAAAEAAQRAAAEAAQRAAEEAARKAAAEAAQKAAEEAARKAAAEEAAKKAEAEEAERRATKAAIAEAARKEAEEEESKSFIDAAIDIYEKSRKYNEDIKKIEQQALVEQVELAEETMSRLWDNYMFSMEQNQATTQATAEGINQWGKIIAGDASDLTEEQRGFLHKALDIMGMLPGGGVYDWLNAELYAAEGNTTMAATCTLAVAVPGMLPALNQAAKYLTKGSDLIDLIFRSGSVDEAIESMVKYGDDLKEAGETLAKQLAEEGAEETGEKVVKDVVEGSTSTTRPTWRQSELDAATNFPEYDAQKSFINGEEVPYGTKGSVRPDYYKDGFSVDIKNYNVESASGRRNLARNIEKQYYQRIENLPDGAKQFVMIDIRGQNVSDEVLNALYDDIMQRTNNGVEILFKMD